MANLARLAAGPAAAQAAARRDSRTGAIASLEALAAKGAIMPAYVILGNFTEQGIRNIKRLADLRQAA